MSAREANTGSPVSSRAITWPATGAFTTVVAAAAAAGTSVLVAVAVAVAVVAAGAASFGFDRRSGGLLIGGGAGQHFSLLFRGAVVEGDDQEEGGQEGDRDGHRVHPHLVEDRNGQQRGEGEGGGGHTMHGLAAAVTDGKSQPRTAMTTPPRPQPTSMRL